MSVTGSARRSGLLRFITAGSVDDGKSTLIGRLLYDSKGLLADQLTAIEAASRRRGMETVDLSLLTDGLLAEREQGITIDVAYRYFATPARKFIIGDSPGHAQYTRNMVTAASTADLAVLLVDARHGLREQTRRHAYLARWVGIDQVVLAVNKMDLVGFERGVFDGISAEFKQFAGKLGFSQIRTIPVSALLGHNIVSRAEEMAWYEGPTLMQYLETVPARHNAQDAGFRFPVQRVVRLSGGNAQPGSPYEQQEFRGYQGTIASGRVSVGDEVVVLPSGGKAKVQGIVTADGDLESAVADMAVTLQLDNEIDVSRGDLISEVNSRPALQRDVDAQMCWFDTQPLDPARPYLIKNGGSTVRAKFISLRHRIDIETLEHRQQALSMQMNDIACVQLRVQRPIAFDTYRDNRVTGGFIVIDETSNHTVAAGTLL